MFDSYSPYTSLVVAASPAFALLGIIVGLCLLDASMHARRERRALTLRNLRRPIR